MNETLNTAQDIKKQRKERTKNEMSQGAFKDQSNIIIALIGAIVFGFIYSFTLTSGYYLLNLTLALLLGLVILDILIIRSKEYDLKNLIFWNIIIVVFTSIFYRTTINYYLIMASLAYPTLFVSLVLFATKKKHLNGARFIGQHFAFFAHLGHIFKALSLTRKKESNTWKIVSNVLVGCAIAVIALLVIVPIMSDADIFFENFMDDIFEDLFDIEISEFTWKVILGVFFTMCGFGFIYTGLVKQYKSSINDKQLNISQIIIITILSIIGVAYLAFISTQIKHLFFANPTGVLEGAKYAEYARSGFFEMVWLCTINIFIILGCILFSNNQQQHSKLLKTLMMYFNVVNLYMLVVSFYKMYLYQSEFGFTEKRILVYIYIIFQLVVLALLTVKIFNQSFKFWLTILYFSCVFWAAISFINIQGLSFELNVNRYKKTGEIDTNYLNGYNDKAASKAVKNFYFEYNGKMDQSHHEDIINYFAADSKYEADESLMDESANKHDLLEVNIQNSAYEKNAEIVLSDFYHEFVTKVQESVDR